MKRLLVAAGIVAVAATACSNSSGTATGTPTPSAVISTIAAQANQAVCQAQGKIIQLVSQFVTGATTSKQTVVTKLGDLQTALNGQASTLANQGQTALATGVRNLANAVGQLMTAVQGQSPAAAVSAAQKVESAAASLPACPTPTASG